MMAYGMDSPVVLYTIRGLMMIHVPDSCVHMKTRFLLAAQHYRSTAGVAAITELEAWQ